MTRNLPMYSLRGNVHTYRNAGMGSSRMLVLATPGGLDEYLQQISDVQMPEDAERLFRISSGFGIHFVLPETVESKPELAAANA